MNSGLKQRLVGAVVLVAIGVIFVPTFLRDRQVEPVSTKTLIPERPPRETVTFDNPTPPEDIEPAPEPETMFMPEPANQAADESSEEPDPETPPAPAPNVGEAEEEEQPPVEPPQEQAADGQAWVIQVASLRSTDSARELRDKLQGQGYRAYIRSANTSAGEVSRVFIGPKISRSEAETVKAEVDKALKVDALIMRFEP